MLATKWILIIFWTTLNKWWLNVGFSGECFTFMTSGWSSVIGEKTILW